MELGLEPRSGVVPTQDCLYRYYNATPLRRGFFCPVVGDCVEKVSAWSGWRGVRSSLGRVFSCFCHHLSAVMELRWLNGMNRRHAGAGILRSFDGE